MPRITNPEPEKKNLISFITYPVTPLYELFTQYTAPTRTIYTDYRDFQRWLDGHTITDNLVKNAQTLLASPKTYDLCEGDPSQLDFITHPLFYLLVMCMCFIMGIYVFTYAVKLYEFAIWCGETSRFAYSWILYHGNQIVTSPANLRTIFANMPLITTSKLRNHTHPDSAKERNSALTSMLAFAQLIGRAPYIVAQSRADQRNSRPGSRSYFFAKDLGMEPSNTKPGPNDIIIINDVDYYIDMPYLLANNCNPVLLTGFYPELLTAAQGEFAYTCDSAGKYSYAISGGSEYSHHVWLYDKDVITCYNKLFGIPYSSTTYVIDRRPTSFAHQMVLLSPIAKYGLLSTLTYWFLQYDTLTRFNPVTSTHLLAHKQTNEGRFVQVSRVNSYTTVEIPVETFDTIQNSFLTSKNVTRASVQSVLINTHYDSDNLTPEQASFVLYDYFLTQHPSTSFKEYLTKISARMLSVLQSMPLPPTIFPNLPVSRPYTFKQPDDDAKPNMTPFMAPIINGAFIPLTTKSNEEAAIKERITDLQKDVPVTPYLLAEIQNFVNLLYPVPHQLHPVDIDTVYEKQHKPSQRAILKQADTDLAPEAIAKSFIKAEAYPEPKAPRVITTVNGPDKIAWSQFLYALADDAKRIPCYAFGRKPFELYQAFALSVSIALHFIKLTDFSKYDGTYSLPLRMLERAVLLRAFAVEFHDIILEKHTRMFNLPGVGRLGTRYNTKDSRNSGEPGTSFFNTIANMFTVYLGFRATAGPNGEYLTPEDAYEQTLKGMFGGDDGKANDLEDQPFLKACTMLGLKAKINNIRRGDLGVEFLARCFTRDVWFGNPSNCCDPARQLSKFHVSVNRPENISPETILLEKCTSFALTDGNTPVIGPFAKRVVHIAQTDYRFHLSPNSSYLASLVESGVSLYDGPELFCNEPHDDYLEIFFSKLPNFSVDTFQYWLEPLNSLTHALSPPLCQETETVAAHPTLPLVVDDTIIPPKQATNDLKPNKHSQRRAAKVSAPPKLTRSEAAKPAKDLEAV